MESTILDESIQTHQGRMQEFSKGGGGGGGGGGVTKGGGCGARKLLKS